MKIGITLSLILLVMTIWACKGSKKTTTDTPTDKPAMMDMNAGTGKIFASMRKTPCFGRCPVYTLNIFDNGRVEFRGGMNTDKQGVYSKTLPIDSFNRITQAIITTDLWQYEDFYNSDLPDLPKTIITHYRADSSKAISGDHLRPKAILQLEKMLKNVASSGEWTQEEMNVPYNTIKGEIIVDLLPGVEVESLEKAFEAQGLVRKKQMNPNGNLWLFSYDEEKVSLGRLCVLLKNHEGVKMVDVNKKLGTRR